MDRWQRRWKRVKNVPGLSRNLTAVGAGILVGLLVVTYVLTNVKFIAPWEHRLVLNADFTSADALSPGSSPKVRVAGVDVGQVTGVELTHDGKARVTMSLDSSAKVYRDATAVLRPKSVLNEMYIEIGPGHPGTGTLGNNGTIPVTRTERPVQADQVFQDLDERTRHAFSDLLSMSDVALANARTRLPVDLRSLHTALQTYRPILTKLATRRRAIAQLVTAVSQIAAATGGNQQRAGRLVTSLERTLSVLAKRQNQVVASIDQLPGLESDLRGASGKIGRFARVLNPTLTDIKKASKTLPPTLSRLTSTVGHLRRTFVAAKPVIRGARPFMGLLGPVVKDARFSLAQLVPTSARVDPALDVVVPHLVDLRAFVYNTSGVMTASDATGGMIRGHVAVPLPAGGLIAGTNGGFPSPLESHGGRR